MYSGIIMKNDIKQLLPLDFEKVDGLIPCVVQNYSTQKVLMLGYMNKEAIEKTFLTQKVTFYSRSKNRLWTKGETSGNFLKLVSLSKDCDDDALLARVIPNGPTCHKNTESCFVESPSENPEDVGTVDFLMKLENIISSRLSFENNQKSYVKALFQEGIEKVAQKVGEEAVETVIASLGKSEEDFLNESSDLVFHLLLLLKARNISILDICNQLEKRHR